MPGGHSSGREKGADLRFREAKQARDNASRLKHDSDKRVSSHQKELRKYEAEAVNARQHNARANPHSHFQARLETILQ